MLEWIFLDVGNVLLDEDPLTYLSFRRHAEAVLRAHPGSTFRDLLAACEARAAAGSRWPVSEVVSAFLDEPRLRRDLGLDRTRGPRPLRRVVADDPRRGRGGRAAGRGATASA